MKKKMNQILSLLMVVIVLLGSIDLTAVTVSAADKREIEPLVTAKQTVSSNAIYSDEEVEVSLQIEADRVKEVTPCNVILLMDRSSSMRDGNRFNMMIDYANFIIDNIDLDLHNLGVVDYADTVNSLTFGKTKDEMRAYLDDMECGGKAIADQGINQTITNLAASESADRKSVVIYLSAGQPEAVGATEAAIFKVKSKKIAINTVAFLGEDEDVDTSAANKLMMGFATSPRRHFPVQRPVHVEDAAGSALAQVGTSTAYCFGTWQQVSSNFEVIPESISGLPTGQHYGNVLYWDIADLNYESLNLKFKIKVKDGVKPGTYYLNNKIMAYYIDHNGIYREIELDNIPITVKDRASTGPVVTPEPTPVPTPTPTPVPPVVDPLAPTISHLTESITTTAAQLTKAFPGDVLYVHGTNYVDSTVTKVVFTDSKGKEYVLDTSSVISKRVRFTLPKEVALGTGSLRIENTSDNVVRKSAEYAFTVRDAYQEFLDSIETPTISHLTESITATAAQLTKAFPGDVLYVYGTNYVDSTVTKVVFTDSKGKEYVLDTSSVISKRVRFTLPKEVALGTGSLRIENKIDYVNKVSEEYTFTVRDAYQEFLDSIETPTISHLTESITATAAQLTKAFPGDVLYVHGTNYVDSTVTKVVFTDSKGKEYVLDTSSVISKRVRFTLPKEVALGTGSLRIENKIDYVNKVSEEYTFTVRDAHQEFLDSIETPTISYVTKSSTTTSEQFTEGKVGEYLYIHGTNFVDNTVTKVIFVDARGQAHEIATASVTAKRLRIVLPATVATGTGYLRVVNQIDNVDKRSEEFQFSAINPKDPQ